MTDATRSEPTRLLVLTDIPDEHLERIRAVDPVLEIEVQTAGFRACLKGQKEPLSSEEQAAAEAYAEALARSEIVLMGFLPPPGLPQTAPRLRWLHTAAAGIDRMQGTPVLQSDIVITNAGEAAAGIVAEYALWLMLALTKHGLHLADAQRRREWDTSRTPIELWHRTLAIVGLGAIGRQIARLARPFDMRIVGTRRSATARHADPPLVDLVYPPGELEVMLGEADIVVIAAPKTAETIGMIGARQLDAMRPGSFLVNIARGPIVDEAALIAALQRGHLGGAALDVFTTEPLDPASPLWSLENCIVTPHRGGVSDQRAQHSVDGFVANLERYLRGEPLVSVVDKRLGY